MSSTTTASSAHQYRVWVQPEGMDAIRLVYEPETTVIDALKKMVFKENRFEYQAFFRQQYLRPGGLIPDETSDLDPIILRLIKDHRSSTNPEDDDDFGAIALEPVDRSRTRTTNNNREMVSRFNKCIDKGRSNYDRGNNNGVSNSREYLLSTEANSSEEWTFNSLFWQAASTLWSRITNGNTTSRKSKSE